MTLKLLKSLSFQYYVSSAARVARAFNRNHDDNKQDPEIDDVPPLADVEVRYKPFFETLPHLALIDWLTWS